MCFIHTEIITQQLWTSSDCKQDVELGEFGLCLKRYDSQIPQIPRELKWSHLEWPSSTFPYITLSGSLALERLKGKFMRNMHSKTVSYNLRQGFSELGHPNFWCSYFTTVPKSKNPSGTVWEAAVSPPVISLSFPRSWSVTVSPWVMLSGWISYIARGDVQRKAIISGISMHAEFSQPTQSMKVLGCMTQLWVGKTIGKRRQTKSIAKQLLKNGQTSLVCWF